MALNNGNSHEMQVQAHLSQLMQQATDLHRPLLLHLNADTTWMLSLPHPLTYKSASGRSRYNILIDPWLRGAGTQYFKFFLVEWHTTESCVQSIKELNDLLREAEGQTRHDSPKAPESTKDETSYIDLVMISQDKPDHCHQPTLAELSLDTPIVAVKGACDMMRSWKQPNPILEMKSCTRDTDWRKMNLPPLPPWLSVSRLVPRLDIVGLHGAILFCFALGPSHAEGIIYTPHGVAEDVAAIVEDVKPKVEVLALLHGLHDIGVAGPMGNSVQANLGAQNALKVQRRTRAKYWLATHDETKDRSGLIGKLLRTKSHTVHDVLQRKEAVHEKAQASSDHDREMMPKCLQLPSGHGVILE